MTRGIVMTKDACKAGYTQFLQEHESERNLNLHIKMPL